MGVKVDFKVNVPHGEMDITENGQYDVSDYAIANVNVAFETEEKSVTITENGTQEVLPSVGKDALSKVVINAEIPIKEEQSKNVEIKENGTISVLPDEGKVLNEVSITTNVPQDNTLKKLLDTTKNSSYLFKNYGGTSVDDLIQYNDTENVTSMTSMFDSAYNINTIPLLNTSKVIYMSNMFSYCSKLTTIPLLNTSNVKYISALFSECKNLTTVPLLDTSNVEQFGSVFYNCINLKVIPALNLSKCNNLGNMFYKCNNLEEIHMVGMKVNFDISASTKFTREALVEILNNLATVTTTKTLKMGATNLARLTDEDKLIATNKGWTLA